MRSIIVSIFSRIFLNLPHLLVVVTFLHRTVPAIVVQLAIHFVLHLSVFFSVYSWQRFLLQSFNLFMLLYFFGRKECVSHSFNIPPRFDKIHQPITPIKFSPVLSIKSLPLSSRSAPIASPLPFKDLPPVAPLIVVVSLPHTVLIEIASLTIAVHQV